MSTVDKVASWMRSFGWPQGGWPGDFKRDANGAVIAAAGDNTWINDMEEACAKVERDAIIAELERRDRERGSDAPAAETSDAA